MYLLNTVVGSQERSPNVTPVRLLLSLIFFRETMIWAQLQVGCRRHVGESLPVTK
jgi:hypothetical protein